MGQIIKAILSPITSLVSAFTGGDKDEDRMPEPAAPQRDAALDAQLAQTQADALAARQAADEQARAERESIAKQLAESEAREAERETKEKAAAAEDTRQRALRARGRASLIAQGSTEEGVKTTFGG